MKVSKQKLMELLRRAYTKGWDEAVSFAASEAPKIEIFPVMTEAEEESWALRREAILGTVAKEG